MSLRQIFMRKKKEKIVSLIFLCIYFYNKCDLKIYTIYYRAFIIYFCCFIVPNIAF